MNLTAVITKWMVMTLKISSIIIVTIICKRWRYSWKRMTLNLMFKDQNSWPKSNFVLNIFATYLRSVYCEVKRNKRSRLALVFNFNPVPIKGNVGSTVWFNNHENFIVNKFLQIQNSYLSRQYCIHCVLYAEKNYFQISIGMIWNE